jgi:hypothetical protein
MNHQGVAGMTWRGAGRWPVVVGALVVLVSLVLTLPRTLWESDECLFVQAVARFDPLHHHPHPPGYPLLVGLGKAVNVVVGDPFASLVVLAVLSSLAGFLALAALFENIFTSSAGPFGPISATSPRGLAVVGALLFFLSPAMLVHSTLPMSDPPALAFLALALWTCSGGAEGEGAARAVAAGAFFSAAVGCRPQLAVAVLPTFAVALAQMSGWRRRSLALATFALVSLAWLAPLAAALGGPGKLFAWETAQAGYVASHDAALSRGGKVWAEIVLRYTAHPWGPKYLAVPVLVAAAAGAVLLIGRRAGRALPLAVVALVQLCLCIALMDPADGVRYALPTLPAVAVAAAAGLGFLGWRLGAAYVPALVLAAFAVGSAAYVLPIVRARMSSPSPPVQAARFAAGSLPPGSVILVEPPLRPHGELLLGSFTTVPVLEGWAQPPGRSAGPFFLFADRRLAGGGAAVFEWPECDAYGKLTRNHYRVVSLAPVSRYGLYRPVRGFYAIERDESGNEWRWAGPEATLQLTNYGCGRVRLALGLDKEAPFASTTVEVLLDRRPAGRLEIPRGGVRALEIPLAGGDVVEVTVRSDRSYVPAEHRINRDTRRLSVQVVAVEQFCP